MKRLVLTYWLCPDEEQEFIDFLETTGDIVAYTVEWKAKPDDIRPTDLRRIIESANPAQLMVGLRTGYTLVEKHVFDDRVKFNVTAHRSALLIYQRGRLLGRQLGQSNLAAYYGVAERPSDEDRSFHEWCRKVYRWVKERTPQKDPNGFYRISSRAAAAAQRGDFELHV
ncbi:MAG TPA: hypothetical protein VHE61_10270 [Opitutaceae bacterium]|nr:hypothetical protein [Opitutaceae bacterium]